VTVPIFEHRSGTVRRVRSTARNRVRCPGGPRTQNRHHMVDVGESWGSRSWIPPRGSSRPLPSVASVSLTVCGCVCVQKRALAPSPADKERQSHDHPSHEENLNDHPYVPPCQGNEFHSDHPSTRGHSIALSSASLRPGGCSGQRCAGCKLRQACPRPFVSWKPRFDAGVQVPNGMENLPAALWVSHLDAARREFHYLVFERQALLDVLSYEPPGLLKISPSREASGLVVMSSPYHSQPAATLKRIGAARPFRVVIPKPRRFPVPGRFSWSNLWRAGATVEGSHISGLTIRKSPSFVHPTGMMSSATTTLALPVPELPTHK